MASTSCSNSVYGFYILLEDCLAERKRQAHDSISKLNFGTFGKIASEQFQVVKGSIWKSDETGDIYSSNEPVYTTQDYPDFEEVKLSGYDVHKRMGEIDDRTVDLLRAVKSFEERFKLYRNKDRIVSSGLIQVNSYVYLVKNSASSGILCKVRYVGELVGKTGIWFGIEILDRTGKYMGSCNGTWNDVKYFTCEPDTGEFVAANHLIHCPDPPCLPEEREETPPPPIPPKSLATYSAPIQEKPVVYDRPPGVTGDPPLSKGERVVWMTDHSPEFGTVRWIGYLAELKESSWTVGVDFDNPIGTGTGKYKDQQLFKTALNHASLIPIMGLMRVSELGLPDPKYTSKNVSSRMSATVPRTRQSAQDHVNSKHNFIRASTPDRPDNSPWERRTPPTTMNYSTNGGTGMSGGSISTPLRESDPSYNIMDKVGRPKGRTNAPHSANLSPAVNPRDLLPKDCNSDDVETMSLEKRAGAAVKKQAKAAKNAIMNQLKRKKASVGSGGGSGGGDSTANTSTDSETFNLDDLASSLGRGILSSNTRNARQSSESEGGSLATPPQSKPPSKAPSKSGSSDERGKTSSPKPLDPASLNTQLSYGSMVEVNSEDGSHFGVARWFGYKEDINSPIVGLEMDDLNGEEDSNATQTPKREGILGGKSLFECTSGGKPAFYPLKVCQRDRRFEENTVSRNGAGQHSPFGNVECPEVVGHVDPLSFDCIADLNPFCGKNKGIQGHKKSCYLDTTLFSMFAFTSVFDEILCRPKKEQDIVCFEEIQTILRESVVNPLRKNFFVRADKVLNLRGMLDRNSSVKGLTNEEKDPEEFLGCLLQQTFDVSPPYLRLSSGVNAYYYQLFVEKDDCVLPNTQHLLGLSFFQNDLKLMSVPSVLILQMPRCGKDFKMYPKIIPSLYLDITDVLEYSVRQCAICGTIATLECRECFSHFGNSLDKIAFCAPCSNRSHGHQRRKHHRPRPLKSPNDAKYRSNMSLASLDSRRETLTADEVSCREVMELFAVICIRTSHYVAYCKTACSEKAPWVFFDSMADREGQENGYNIPEVKLVDRIREYLSDKERLHTAKDVELDELLRRLVCDAYICFYRHSVMCQYS